MSIGVVPPEGLGTLPPDPSWHERFEALFREHQGRIYRICLSFMRNPHDAEDATQETFARAAQGMVDVEDAAGYLNQMARNLCVDLLRRGRKRDQITGLLSVDPIGEPVREALDRIECNDVWDRLGSEDRKLIAMSFAGLSYAEMAIRTKASAKLVSVNLSRARRRARDLVASFVPGSLLRWAAGKGRGMKDPERQTFAAQGVSMASSSATLAALVAAVTLGPALAQPLAVATATPVASRVALAATAGGTAPAASPVAPTAASGAAAPQAGAPRLSVAHVVGVPDNNPSGYGYYNVAVSPAYAQDHTIYAAGWKPGCRASCSVILKSTDGGATWTSQASTGYTGQEVFLSPAWTADHTMFGFDPGAGLERSTDGGATFVPAVPGSVAASIAPVPGPSGARVASFDPTAHAVTYYDAGTGVATGAVALPPGSVGTDLSFVGSSAHLLVSVVSPPSPASVSQAALITCEVSTGCGAPVAFPRETRIRLSVSPAFAQDHTIAAFSADHLYLSHDGGASFTESAHSFAGALTTVSLVPNGAVPRVVLGLWQADGQANRASVLESTSDGTGFVALGSAQLAVGARPRDFDRLPDGTMLASFDTPVGLMYSTDGGSTWRVAQPS